VRCSDQRSLVRVGSEDMVSGLAFACCDLEVVTCELVEASEGEPFCFGGACEGVVAPGFLELNLFCPPRVVVEDAHLGGIPPGRGFDT
jgi:hypothetical protein